ncbi:MAG: nicotinate-nicotinamide nucleotide adenylyltransferase [Gammaproteobacteria bacterium]|nr:MAG: nicotinate-nicotinamide nucleotide adenylyltransferase [Gammaproteobacteria bacterium]
MNSEQVKKGVAVLGGTFDPIHLGHLRLATDLIKKLNLEHLRLMPSYQPVHRDTPSATIEQRLEMLKLAVVDSPELIIDERELTRKGPSYTLDSLKELRAEIGPSTPLYFILGIDAFCLLDTWHQWQHLTDFAHLVVAVRPGKHPDLSAKLSDYVQKVEYKLEGYPTSSKGSVIFMKNALLDISSTAIRKGLKEGNSVSNLVPKQVSDYLNLHKIYCSK